MTLPTLLESLKKREFDGSIARQEFWSKPGILGAEAYCFENGASWQHAQDQALIVKLCEALERAHEALLACKEPMLEEGKPMSDAQALDEIDCIVEVTSQRILQILEGES